MSGERVQLDRPVAAFGENISEIEIGEPTAKDARQLGLPYRINGDESVSVDTGVCGKYLLRLGSDPVSGKILTPATVDALTARDFNLCCQVIMGFFGESPESGDVPKKPGEKSETPAEMAPATPSETPPT